MKKLLIVLFLVVLCSGCGSTIQRLSTGMEKSRPQNYKVTLYSGGIVVKSYEFKGIILCPENSDGYQFFVNNKLVEVSGTVLIEQQ